MTHRGYIGQVQEVRPVLAGMEDRGMPIDDTARLALDAEFDKAQREVGAWIAERVSVECKRLHPVDGYKGVPPEVKKSVAEDGTYTHIPVLRFCEPRDDGEWYHYEQREFRLPVMTQLGPHILEETRWCRVYDFNPNSSKQLIAYMKFRGHPVPKDKHREGKDGNPSDTTAEKELRRLAARTNDLLYLKVVEYRGFTKMRGTYVQGFIPRPETGCVHTSFTFDTGIGQLGSRNPNVQNFPKLKPTVALAKAMRRMVAAKPGHIITEWDFKSCHVITLGFLAEDLNYMRLGRLDIHSFVAGHFLKHWNGFEIFNETDDQLRARFKWLKSDPVRKRVRDDQAKHAILGIGNGLKAKGLYERYLESFPPEPCSCVTSGTAGKEQGVRGLRNCRICAGSRFIPGARIAQQVLEVCEALFPNVFAYQKAEAKRAHDQQYLRSQFGHIRRFYEVFRWDFKRGGGYESGDQHEQAIAFRLANIAFGHIREKLKELHAAGLDETYGLFNNVHDSFMFHFPESQLEQHIRDVHPLLTSPSKVLRHPTICPDGLVIEVEGAWGPNWASMSEIDVRKTLPVIPSPLLQEAPHDAIPAPSLS